MVPLLIAGQRPLRKSRLMETQIVTVAFPHLFEPLKIRDAVIRNRILSTGHQTYLARGGLPTEAMIAYHAARAKGGAGLIITESARFHPTSISDAHDLLNLSDDCIPHYARLAKAVQAQGARIFGQLSHAGRVTRRMRDGMRGVVYAPSAVPENRFHTVPREMSTDLIAELTASAGAAAGRLREAGYDGVELMASHGLLFAQFLNPHANRREDRYGGPLENRMRALVESLIAVRAAVGPGMAVGLRISSQEGEPDGLKADDVQAVCEKLSQSGLVDYLNVTTGSMAGLGSSVHVVPPMEIEPAYLAGDAQAIRSRVAVPVFVAGRINQPQIAEQVLARGQADMCAMTRALITDPEMPNKARTGRTGAIKACIGCNQGCIGHFHAGNSISCIQSPRSGRELLIPEPRPATQRLRVMVVGGGPAGLKAAVTAAEDGHSVILHEAGPVLGGQAALAQLLPHRAEFGGLVTNLAEELQALQVQIRLNSHVTPAMIAAAGVDLVVLATGSVPVETVVEGREDGHVVLAEEILTGAATPGARVLIADWRCDWVGIGMALRLTEAGHSVRLAVNGICAGQNLPVYVRDHWAGRIHAAGIEVIPYARIFGVDADTAYLTHCASDQPIIVEGVDTVVLTAGRRAEFSLEQDMHLSGQVFVSVGDCNSARTAEEAVYEGLVETRRALGDLMRQAKQPAGVTGQ